MIDLPEFLRTDQTASPTLGISEVPPSTHSAVASVRALPAPEPTPDLSIDLEISKVDEILRMKEPYSKKAEQIVGVFNGLSPEAKDLWIKLGQTHGVKTFHNRIAFGKSESKAPQINGAFYTWLSALKKYAQNNHARSSEQHLSPSAPQYLRSNPLFPSLIRNEANPQIAEDNFKTFAENITRNRDVCLQWADEVRKNGGTDAKQVETFFLRPHL